MDIIIFVSKVTASEYKLYLKLLKIAIAFKYISYVQSVNNLININFMPLISCEFFDRHVLLWELKTWQLKRRLY